VAALTVRRLFGLLVTLWLAVTLSFIALQLVPGDPAGALLAPNAPPEVVAAERHAMGLDEALPIRYARMLASYARGDLGVSWAGRRAVAQLIAEALPPTLLLALASLALALLAGIGLGGVAARVQGGAGEALIMGAMRLGLSMPVAASGVVALALAPAWAHTGALLLPALVLSASAAGAFARLTRAELLATLRADYIRTAHAKGLPGRVIATRHALRNALVPVAAAAGLQFGFLLGGAVVTEMVFSRPGIGRLLLDAILAQDLPVVQGVVALGALGYALANLLADAVQRVLDPRLRAG
jgi:peptide/nickel transport system permease protein